MFIGLLSVCSTRSFGDSLVSNLKGPIKCVSLINHPCQARSTISNINSDESLFYRFSVSVDKCGRTCNTTDDANSQFFVANRVKNMIVILFNLMHGLNETNRVSADVDWMKLYIIQSKNGIMMNVGVSVKI